MVVQKSASHTYDNNSKKWYQETPVVCMPLLHKQVTNYRHADKKSDNTSRIHFQPNIYKQWMKKYNYSKSYAYNISNFQEHCQH
jgi:hypothetical protein